MSGSRHGPIPEEMTHALATGVTRSAPVAAVREFRMAAEREGSRDDDSTNSCGQEGERE